MQNQDRARLMGALTAVGDLYGRDLSRGVIDLWWAALQRFEWAAVEAAFRRHCESPDQGQFMPKPADIVKLIEGTSADSAQVAWAKVDRAVRCVGPYRSVAFDDPVIHRVITEMGGWTSLGAKDSDEWPFTANEFRARYAAYKVRGELPEYPKHLAGIAEAENGAAGLPVEAPTLIGDVDAAVRVLSGGTTRPLITVTPSAIPRALAAPLRG